MGATIVKSLLGGVFGVASGYCRIPDAGGCGTCDIRSSPGGPCSSNDDCRADLGCLVDAAGKAACVTAVGLGQSCNGDDVVCQSPLFCDPAGSCQVPGKENDPCTVPDSCAQETGLRCGTDGFCHAQPVASAGESCAPVGGIEPICLGGTCDLDASKFVAPLKLGDVCPPPGFLPARSAWSASPASAASSSRRSASSATRVRRSCSSCCSRRSLRRAPGPAGRRTKSPSR